MAFRFIHTADWQIGKPFARFPQDKQAELRDARLEAIDRIAETAAEFGAAHVLMAGDLYDSDGMSGVTLRQPLEAMASAAALTWHVLPGNHDPARAGGIWDRVAESGCPENVRVHADPVAVEIADGVTLLPAPLRSRAVAEDVTAWMDTYETPNGALRIGLAHGSIGRYGTDGHASVPLDPSRAATARLDYLALGDDHGMKQIGPRTWYSGTPEPDGWRQNEPGHVLCVSLDGPGSQPAVTPRQIGKFAWGAFEAGVDSDGAIVGLGDQIDRMPVTRRNCIVRLALRGALTLSAKTNLDRTVDRLKGQLRHLDVDESDVRQMATVDDLSTLGEGSELYKVGMRLMRRVDRATANPQDAAVALIALNELIARNEEHAET
ncbi:MAG: DNA repair exonuclease [Pseudomonadota bacterium]